MAALWNRAGHYIFILWFLSFFMAALCSRGHYIFAMWFPSIFYLSSVYLFIFSSPNLSGHRLDVYHTSTHGESSVIPFLVRRRKLSMTMLECRAVTLPI